MKERTTKITASIGLFIGGLFGMVGSFVTSPSTRALAWLIDGVSLIVAGSLLSVYYFRKGLDSTAAGFLVFAIGEGFILSSSGMNLEENVTSFGAGTGLWAASLFLISVQKTYPLIIRITGLIAALLFSIVSVQIFTGQPLNALSKPLPFYAYPPFVITIFGWAWTLLRSPSNNLTET
ncbi:MAG TPA: hypothetical protein VFX58_07465 [Chitinophagaceae bacterium]|nr:hypothetical protein [Chitinophagaceae bacterium]